jgi:hypothetical protein
MNLQLMREYEEFEGLGNQVVDDTAGAQENEDDDPTFRPQQASELTSNEIYYQVAYSSGQYRRNCVLTLLSCITA